MFTEGCVERFNSQNYQLWKNGEHYGTSMINDFNNGTMGWTDWNILLDQNGRPNHVGNFCFASIHADTGHANKNRTFPENPCQLRYLLTLPLPYY